MERYIKFIKIRTAASPYRGRCRGSNIENKENSCGIQAVHYQTLRDTHYFNRMVKAQTQPTTVLESRRETR